MAVYFPFFVNLDGKKFCVYGAGSIAARRIGGLLRYGARITVIAPQIHLTIEEWEKELYEGRPRLLIERRRYCAGEIQKETADFVLAATDNKEVNSAIYRECRVKKIPVNNASDKSECDFYFPALIEQEDLVIGVTSTSGDHKKVAVYSEKLRRCLKDRDKI